MSSKKHSVTPTYTNNFINEIILHVAIENKSKKLSNYEHIFLVETHNESRIAIPSSLLLGDFKVKKLARNDPQDKIAFKNTKFS